MNQHQSVIEILNERKFKLDAAYSALVIEGDVEESSPAALMNRKSANEILRAIQILEYHDEKTKIRKSLIEIFMGFALITVVVCASIVALAFYLAEKFHENDLNFDFI